MLNIVKFKTTDKENTRIAFDIRNSVFVKEQNVDPNIEVDNFESTANHYLAYLKDIAVGAARWRKTCDGIKLERFAVIKDYRNKGVGQQILEAILEDIINLQGEIYLHSQLDAVDFYQKNGFTIVGDIFIEAGIEHYKMVYKH